MVEELEDLYDIMQAEKILARGFEEEGSTLEELEKSDIPSLQQIIDASPISRDL